MIGMAGYFGPSAEKREGVVRGMLDRLRCRGEGEIHPFRGPGIVMGGIGGAAAMAADGSAALLREGDDPTKADVERFMRCGPAGFSRLRGPFAIAAWDGKKRELCLSRDVFGLRTLYAAQGFGGWLFASDLPALASALEEIHPDPRAMMDIASAWSCVGDHTFYAQIRAVECGCTLVLEANGDARRLRHSALTFSPPAAATPQPPEPTSAQGSTPFAQRPGPLEGSIAPTASPPKPPNDTALVDELDRLLNEAIQRRLNLKKTAFYLSGGLDSSLIASMAARQQEAPIHTFSLAFRSAAYDESPYQQMMAETLGSVHHRLTLDAADIARLFPQAVALLRTPLVRLGTAPMLALSQRVRQEGFTAVLSGEGADELFGGYDIYKEVKIREFCRRRPGSPLRPLLYRRLYPYITGFSDTNPAALAAYFGHNEAGERFSSHAQRFRFGAYVRTFLAPELRSALEGYDVRDAIWAGLPDAAGFDALSPIAKAQLIEIETFHNRYLIEQQALGICLSNGVECLCPFLDADVVDFALRLPDSWKLRGLGEKALLKRVAARYLPEALVRRPKFPYRAPVDAGAILREARIARALAASSLTSAGLFNEKAVTAFLRRLSTKEAPSERDQMLLLFIASAQLLGTEAEAPAIPPYEASARAVP